MFNTPVYFNNVNLASLTGVQIYNHDFISTPTRILNRSKLARADQSVLTSAEYSEKTVTVTGFICGTDKNDIENNYNNFKGAIQVPEGTIRVEQSGEDVEYFGTLNQIEKEYFGAKLKFTVGFLCSNPIGQSRATYTLLNITNTNSTATTQITVLGSFKANPITTVTLTSGTGLTAKTVSILNSATGQGIKVTRTWAANDIMTIDSSTMIVTVNGQEVDYTGTFPTYYPGIRSFQYIDDFTTRNVGIVMTYKKRYA